MVAQQNCSIRSCECSKLHSRFQY